MLSLAHVWAASHTMRCSSPAVYVAGNLTMADEERPFCTYVTHDWLQAIAYAEPREQATARTARAWKVRMLCCACISS